MLQLEFSNTTSHNISIKLIDITGKWRQVLYQGGVNSGTNSYRFTIDSKVVEGLYFIEIKDELTRYFKKVIIE